LKEGIMGERSPSHLQSRKSLWERIKRWHPGSSRPASRDSICPSRWHELHAVIQATGPLRVDYVDLPGTDVTLRITRPYTVYTDGPKFGPYWGEIWPSGVILAEVIARDPHVLLGRRVLELGPGLGVTAVAALQAGADLVVADARPGSLDFCALNTLDNVGIEPKTVCVNWRKPSREFFAVAGEGFSLVLAADVLYDYEDVEPLITLVERILAPGGELWLAEPGRNAAQDLVKTMRKRGWHDEEDAYTSLLPDPHDRVKDVVTVHRLCPPSATQNQG